MATMRLPAVTALCLALVAGCAPNDQTTDPNPPDETGTPFNAGDLSGITTGPIATPLTTTGPGVTLSGIVGNFQRLGYDPGVNGPGVSHIYYSPNPIAGRSSHLFRIRLSGTGLQQLTFDSLTDLGQISQGYPSIDPSGTRLVYSQQEPQPGRDAIQDLFELPLGGSPRLVTSVVNGRGLPSWMPDGNSVVYSFTETDNAFNRMGLLQVQLSDGAGTQLTQGIDRDATTGLVGGIPTVIFARGGKLWTVDLTTHDTTIFLEDPAHGYSQPRLSNDGSRLLYWDYSGDPGPNLRSVHTQSPTIGNYFPRPTQPPGQAYDADWGPDGSEVIALQYSEIQGSSQLSRYSSEGIPLAELSGPPQGIQAGISVGPFVPSPPRDLIGPGAALGSTASGIIFGQGGNGVITAVVSFHSLRPRSVVLEAQTGLNAGAPVLTYLLHANQIDAIRFVGDPEIGEVITIVDSTTTPTISGALITFEANTGHVSLILPFSTTNVAGGAPAVVDRGSSRLFSGHFLGAFRGDGTNVAPGGAEGIDLTMATGAVRLIH